MYGPNDWWVSEDDQDDRDDRGDADTYFAYDENNYEDREDDYRD